LPRLSAATSLATDTDDASLPKGNETVLIVEDDPAVRRVVTGMRASLGYRTHEASDGADALQRLERKGKVDLVLTDVVMPGQIGGWELAKTVNERWPEIRILLTSGYSDRSLGEGEWAHVQMHVLPKPYRKRELARKIREALQLPVTTEMQT
jgi:CheY-like chemotaxis protein